MKIRVAIFSLTAEGEWTVWGASIAMPPNFTAIRLQDSVGENSSPVSAIKWFRMLDILGHPHAGIIGPNPSWNSNVLRIYTYYYLSCGSRGVVKN
jgi:hypothetical protein